MVLAIIGLAGRFPEAPDLGAFRTNLRIGRDSVRPLSTRRRESTGIDLDEPLPEVAFIEDIDYFDFRFFRLSKSEAVNMDPHHRLLLECTYHALESANLPIDRLAGEKVGVYLTAMKPGYSFLADPLDPTSITGNMPSVAAGRIARFFDWRGPALVVDSACSSGLMALEAASRDLASGACDFALVGAANLRTVPEDSATLAASGIFSPRFRARSFSDDADGTGCGEAVGIVLLQRVEDAENEGNFVHAVVRAIASNQDGARAATLTAPDVNAQVDVINAAWRAAAIDPAHLIAVEAHGSGTRLGDPIEVKALNLAFSEHTLAQQFCALSSVKANIGHCDTAAGLVGLLKAVLSVKNRELYPAVNFSSPNRLIDFDAGAVFVNNALLSVSERSAPLLVGVTSLSLCGTNCHAVIAEPPSRIALPFCDAPRAILLSATDQTSLSELRSRLRQRLANDPAPDLGALADVLLYGRTHHRERCAYLAGSVEELCAQLDNDCPPEPIDIGRSGPFVMVFSESDNSADVVNRLRHIDQVFETAFVEAGGDTSSEKCQSWRFAVQYALAKRLQHAGLLFSTVMGDGLGTMVIKCLRGESKVSECALVAAGEKPANTPEPERIQALLGKTGTATFVEVGPIGHITAALKEKLPSEAHRRVIALDCDLNIESFLAQLYQLGIPMQSKGRPGLLDLELPPYPFRREPCWAHGTLRTTDKNRILEHAPWVRRLVWRPRNGRLPQMREIEGHRYGIVGGSDEQQLAVKTALRSRGADSVAIRSDSVELVDGNSIPAELHGMVDLRLTRLDKRQDVSMGAGVASFARSLAPVMQQLQRRDFRYVAISRGGQGALLSDSIDPSVAACISLVRSIITENVRADVVGIDLDPRETEPFDQVAEHIATALQEKHQYRFLALRDGSVLVPCLEEATIMPRPATPFRTILVSGGGAGLGLEIAVRFARRGNCRLVLFGRSSDLSQEARDRLESLADRGVSFSYHSVDVGNAELLADVIDTVRESLGTELDCVVHAAGVAGDAQTRLEDKDENAFAVTFAGKVNGLHNLLEALSDFKVGQYLAFSSLAAVIPPTLRADYAAANAALDAIARNARIKGENFTSVRWPPWRGFLMGQQALEGPSPAELTLGGGLQLAEALLNHDDDLPVVAAVDASLRFNSFMQIPGVTDKRIEVECPDPEAQPVEREIWNVWRDVLGQGDFGLDDDFYGLGGHSLNAVQLLGQIEVRVGVCLELSDLIECPTVRLLADRTDRTPRSEEPGLVAQAVRLGEMSTSSAQTGLWIQAQKSPDTLAFNEVLAYEIRGAIDLEAFRNTVVKLVECQEALRTSFVYSGGNVLQRVHDDADINRYFHFRSVSDDAELQRAVLGTTQTNFDLAEWPLFRLEYIQRSTNHVVVVIVAHHVISDGWSNKILLRDVLDAYRGVCELTPPKITYRDFTSWELARTSSAQAEAHLAYWQTHLSGYQSLALPNDRPRTGRRSYDGARVQLPLKDGFAVVSALAKQLGVSTYSLILALVSVVIGKWARTKDLVVLSPVHGRNRRELESVIGCFVNLLCLRTNPDPEKTLRALVNEIWELERDWMRHQDAPFHQVAGTPGLPSDLHQVGLTWDLEERDQVDAGELVVRKLETENKTAKADLWFYGRIVGSELTIAVEYSCEIFEAATINLLAHRLAGFIERAETLLDTPISEIELLSGLEPTQQVRVALDI